jgi:uncharacterized protein YjbI with pentapeptide repeats
MLDWANLKDAHLEGASLRRANLRRANLETACLEGTNLEGAILKRTRLEDADLKAAILVDASMESSYLAGANLRWANLRRANLRRAILRRTHLEEAHLEEAILEEAILVEAYLGRAFLDQACLDRAKLKRANLQECHLKDAILLGADLGGTNLVEANLEGAVLVEANLEGAYLTGANLTNATLGRTYLVDLDLGPFCDASLAHHGVSTVDFASIVRSINCPHLKQFLRDVGLPQVFVDDMVGCARSLNPKEKLMLTLATYIGYVAPDEAFAQRLSQALKEYGLTTFFYPFDGRYGELKANVMHRRIREHDRAVIVCSRASLSRPEIRKELNEVRRRELRLGGKSCLLPTAIDDYVFSEEFKATDSELAEFLAQRIVGDFRGAGKDEAGFQSKLPALADVLRSTKLELVTASAS